MKQMILLVLLIFLLLSINVHAQTLLDEPFTNPFLITDIKDFTHIEKIGNIFHIWNDIHSYYINDTGTQITNNYNNYYTHNVWCLWVNTSSGYQRRCSDGMNWTWANATGVGWVELNGTANYSEGSYSAIFRVRYYLADGYDSINITLDLKNTGQNISDIYYGWLVKDIRIDDNETNNIIRGQDLNLSWHEYDLSKDLKLEFNENQMIRHYQLTNNDTSVAVDFWWDSKNWKNNVEYDNIPFKLNLTHSLFLNQYNTPVLLLLHIGSLNNGETAYTNFWWSDAILCGCDICETGCVCSDAYGCGHSYDGCQPVGTKCCSTTGSYDCATYYAGAATSAQCGFYSGTLSYCGTPNNFCGNGGYYTTTSCSYSNPFGCSAADRTHSCASNTVCGMCNGGANTCGTATCGSTYGCSPAPNVCDGQGTTGHCAAPVGAGSTCYCQAMCLSGLTCTASKCVDTTPPTYTNQWSNVTNNTAVNTGQAIAISARWNDNVQLNNYVNSSKINNSGSWANGTWTAFASGNWTNYTIIIPAKQGSNYTVKIYGNDTSKNQAVTDVWFWWNVSPTTTQTYISIFNISLNNSLNSNRLESLNNLFTIKSNISEASIRIFQLSSIFPIGINESSLFLRNFIIGYIFSIKTNFFNTMTNLISLSTIFNIQSHSSNNYLTNIALSNIFKSALNAYDTYSRNTILTKFFNLKTNNSNSFLRAFVFTRIMSISGNYLAGFFYNFISSGIPRVFSAIFNILINGSETFFPYSVVLSILSLVPEIEFPIQSLSFIRVNVMENSSNLFLFVILLIFAVALIIAINEKKRR